VAWTGDSGDDFAAGWGSWDGYDRFWGNAVSWALPDPGNLRYDVGANQDGASATISVSPAGDPSPALSNATVSVKDAAGNAIGDPVSMAATGGSVEVPADGGPVWQVEIDDGAEVEQQAVALAPGAEWQPAPGGETLLRSIADQTGGRDLTLEDDPATVFDALAEGAGRQEAVGVWWLPALAALAVFLVDIALRLGVTFRSRPASPTT
jgi:hypothetical protein